MRINWCLKSPFVSIISRDKCFEFTENSLPLVRIACRLDARQSNRERGISRINRNEAYCDYSAAAPAGYGVLSFGGETVRLPVRRVCSPQYTVQLSFIFFSRAREIFPRPRRIPARTSLVVSRRSRPISFSRKPFLFSPHLSISSNLAHCRSVTFFSFVRSAASSKNRCPARGNERGLNESTVAESDDGCALSDGMSRKLHIGKRARNFARCQAWAETRSNK